MLFVEPPIEFDFANVAQGLLKAKQKWKKKHFFIDETHRDIVNCFKAGKKYSSLDKTKCFQKQKNVNST